MPKNLVSLTDEVNLSYKSPVASMLLSASCKVSAMETVADHVFFPSTDELTLNA